MKFSRIILFALGFFFFACQSVEKTPKPENLIPEEKMVDILVDLAKVDAAASVSEKEYRKRGSVGKDFIFEKYAIDSAQLVQSNAYYAEQFRLNQRIYEQVEAKLKIENDSLSALKEKSNKENKQKSK